jgi:glycosyltransferase involved in cell wall biosynthesis
MLVIIIQEMLMATTNPLVSIGLPVFNGQRYIQEAIDSILAQTFTDFELIICDNASTDETGAICRQYAEKDARIRYHRNDINIGMAPNFNRVFELSTGPLFKWAAFDDTLAANYLEICVEAFHRAPPSVVLCCPRQTVIDTEGNVIKQSSALSNNRLTDELEGIYEVRFADAAALTGGRITEVIWGMMRREALAKTRLMGSYKAADLVLALELSLLGSFWQLPEYAFFLRLHGQHIERKARTAKQEASWWDHRNRRRFVTPKLAKVLYEDVKAILRSDLTWAEKLRCGIDMRAFFTVRLHRSLRSLRGRLKRFLLNLTLDISSYSHLPLRLWCFARAFKRKDGDSLRNKFAKAWKTPGPELRNKLMDSQGK